jgi:hypothetical protein
MRVSIKAVVLSSLVSTLAFAQPGDDDGGGAPPPSPTNVPVMPPGPPPGPPPTAAPVMAQPPPVAPPEESKVDRGIVEDANAGRSWLAPTALTEPAGTWSFTDYELFLVSLGYAVTDQFSVSATTLLPVTSDFPFVLLVNGKYQLIHEGRVRLAAQGAVTYLSDSGTSASAAVLGGALTLCIDEDCRSYVNGYIGAGFAHEDQSAVPLLFSGSVAMAVNHHVKLVLEADTGYIAGGGIDEAANGFLGWYGVRFTSSIIGVDLGFLKPICTGDTDCSTGSLTMGIPFVSFAYRSLK